MDNTRLKTMSMRLSVLITKKTQLLLFLLATCFVGYSSGDQQFEISQIDQSMGSKLDKNKHYRGTAFLASNIGTDVTTDEILEFVHSCQINLVVIDFAWITHHWKQSQFNAINKVIRKLDENGVEVAIMYRPRVLRPTEARIQYAKKANGEIAEHHNQLCFAYKNSVKWAAKWGFDILKEFKQVDKIILYNLNNPCFCPKCKNGQHQKNVADFLNYCRSKWKRIRPEIQIGHVGIDTEFNEQVDFLCPFLSINRQNSSDLDIPVLIKKNVTVHRNNG